MSEPFFSSSWYRVAALKPRLRSHARIHRHHYRGQLWYVLQDLAAHRYYRFSPAAYCFISLMDGRHTVQELWEHASSRLGDDAPTQNEIIQILMQLHTAEVLQSDVPPDTTAMLLRAEHQRHRMWFSQLLQPLVWRVPLFDPERTLQRFVPLVRFCCNGYGACLWLAVVGTAMILAAVHWQELSHNLTDQVLTPQNMIVLWLLFPVVKILHESGHGFATAVYGGEVHEMGVMFLALQPVPYVDASAASAFRAKRQRIVVDAAGMIVELFLGALAFFVWLNIEPGAVRAVAYNVMFITGVSTVVFNANPLMRYDGYYMFADYLEMPNLRARSLAYISYLCERYLCGCREATPEAATPSERAWLVFYGIASGIYRLFVLAAITLFIADKFFFIGVALALVGIVAWVLVPAVKMATYVLTSPRLRGGRPRALTGCALLVILLVGVIGWVPVPLRTRAEGVIWIPEQAYVRAATDGFIERIVAQPGAPVRQDDVLIICRDQILATRVTVLEFRLQELQTRYTEQWLKDPVQAEIIAEDIAQVKEELQRARERVGELVIRSHTDGTFVLPQAEDLLGAFVRQGTQLGYVLNLTTLTARVVVPQAAIDRVQQHTKGIDVRLAERLSTTLPATIIRVVPAAIEQLPSMALGTQGGGTVTVDPFDTQGVKAMHKLFQLDLALPSRTGVITRGGRVHVRFDHGRQPLVHRWYRQLRQLFLSKFYV
jgi:putative peptide zinc metalloprotease protein